MLDRFRVAAVCIAIALWSASSASAGGNPVAASDACTCGPDFCLGDSRYARVLAAKKEELRGYGARLVELLDRQGKCVRCVEAGPDGFSIKFVHADGSMITKAWTRQEAEEAERRLRAGSIEAYYELYTSEVCACCGEPRAEERSDWSDRLSLNLDTVIRHER